MQSADYAKSMLLHVLVGVQNRLRRTILIDIMDANTFPQLEGGQQTERASFCVERKENIFPAKRIYVVLALAHERQPIEPTFNTV